MIRRHSIESLLAVAREPAPVAAACVHANLVARLEMQTKLCHTVLSRLRPQRARAAVPPPESNGSSRRGQHTHEDRPGENHERTRRGLTCRRKSYVYRFTRRKTTNEKLLGLDVYFRRADAPRTLHALHAGVSRDLAALQPLVPRLASASSLDARKRGVSLLASNT